MHLIYGYYDTEKVKLYTKMTLKYSLFQLTSLNNLKILKFNTKKDKVYISFPKPRQQSSIKQACLHQRYQNIVSWGAKRRQIDFQQETSDLMGHFSKQRALRKPYLFPIFVLCSAFDQWLCVYGTVRLYREFINTMTSSLFSIANQRRLFKAIL